jgi:hypothetical protein
VNLTLKRQLLASDLRKILALKVFVAKPQIHKGYAALAPQPFPAKAFANVGRVQLPF